MTDLTETKEGEWLAICPRFKPFNYYKILYELFDENTKLKELLKECRDVVEFTKTIVNKHKWFDGVIAKINQALGEDK